MSQPARTSTHEVFHPDALATIAALAAGDDQPAWHERALCAETDPEAFFPENGASTRDAKQICSRCPVRTKCLEDALRRDERFGIWGATSETERRVLRRARPPAPAVPAVPAVPEQRTNRARGSGESAPPPGRRAGSGVAGTLPTEPRGHRDQPTRPTSTFPARARRATEPSRPVTAPATRRPASRGGARQTRPRRTGGPTRAEQATPLLGTSPERTNDATNTATATAVETDTGAAPTEDVAAVAPEAPPDPSPPPSDGGRGQQSQRELHDVAKLVLAGQRGLLGSDTGRRPHSDLGGVDLDRVLTLVSAMVDGSPVAPAPMTGPGLWERRIAAVTAVLSGTLTRGRVARASGERAQDVAHWCRRHLEGMALVDTAAYPDGGHATAGGNTAERLVGER